MANHFIDLHSEAGWVAGMANRMMARIDSLLGRVGARNMWDALIKGIVAADLDRAPRPARPAHNGVIL